MKVPLIRTEGRDGVTTRTEVSEEDEDAIDLVTRYAKLEPFQSSVIRFGNAAKTLVSAALDG